MAEKMGKNIKTVVSGSCAVCNGYWHVEVPADGYEEYKKGDKKIQDCLPDTHPFDRECLISGMCYGCQEKMFHRPAPGHEELWGKQIGECSCCGTPVYEKDTRDGEYECSECASHEYDFV